jgi:D-tyrosyl-tRNA(Tyr) deacylase
LRVVIQRVSRASVEADGATVGAIGRGLLLLVGIETGDDGALAERMALKCAEMRLFPADRSHFDRSLRETDGEALVVSQFTLLADVRKGRRPSFSRAAAPDVAAPLVEGFAEALRRLGVTVSRGVFGAMMQVELVNDGPVTVVVDSADLERPRRRGATD